MPANQRGSLPKRVVLDTNVLWSAALSRGSNSARLAQLRGQLTFHLVHEVRLEVWRQLAKFESAPVRRAAVSALIDRFLIEAGVIELPSELGRSYPRGDAAIAAAASCIGAVVCTYNVDHFEEAVTPVSLLRAANFWKNYAETPTRQDQSTILYLIRVHGDRSIGRVLRFDDGTIVTGTEGRFIEVRQPVDGDPHCQKSRIQLPESQLHGLVVRFDSTGRLRIDAWHPSGKRATLGGRSTGQSGNIHLLETTLVARRVWLDRFGRPSNCEGFGVSTAPRWLKDPQVAKGMRVETLEGSVASEDLRDLLAKVNVTTRGDLVVATVDGTDVATNFLPAERWTPWDDDAP